MTKKKWNKYATLCALIASIISILMGYDTGVMSGANEFMEEDMHIKDTTIQILIGILNLCALVGSAAAGRVSDWLGRRRTISLAACIFFVGAVAMGWSPNVPVLFAGRCVAGVGVGFALMIAPVYTAEIAAPEGRGALTSLPEVFISFGILLGYLSNYVFSKLPLRYGWRVMLGLAAPPSLALAVGVLGMPESPRWLAMQGREEEARRVLHKVTNSEAEAEDRLQVILSAVAEAVAHGGGSSDPSSRRSGKGVWKELLLHPTPAVRRILRAALGIHFFEHAVGIEAVIIYSVRIFRNAGVVARSKLLLATVAVGITKTLCILFATSFVDRVGRRPLLLGSTAGIVVFHTLLASSLLAADRHPGHSWALPMSIAATLGFVASFSVGLGPITWVYSSEVFPLRLRAQGAGLGVAVNRLMNAVVSMSFVSLYKAITIYGAFYMFAGVAVIAWCFFYTCLPETRGRPLEEMEELFGGNKATKDVEIMVK